MMDNSTFDKLGALLTDSLIEIVSTVAGLPVEVRSTAQDDDFGGIIGMMNLVGRNGGTIFISTSKACVRILCSRMIGVAPEEVSKEDIDDTLCELVNMAAGSLKLRLGDADGFTLTPPFLIRGEGMSLVTKQGVYNISRLLGNEEISLKLKFIYTDPMEGP